MTRPLLQAAIAVVLVSLAPVRAQLLVENLGRGVVAIRTAGGVERIRRLAALRKTAGQARTGGLAAPRSSFSASLR